MALKTTSLLLLIFLYGELVAQAIYGATSDGQGQNNTFRPNLLPSSPEAFSFVRYGNVPIGLNTGATQFSVPIHTISEGVIKHSILLGYSSNGVKVDEMASRVGINWSLRAGGVITKTVMDLPDDAGGVSLTRFHGVGHNGDSSFYKYVTQSGINGRPDYQPDEYTFSFDGYSGKFQRRENGEFTQFRYTGIKIKKDIGGFVLTTGNGTRYIFSETETARNYSYPDNVSFGSPWFPYPSPTAWYLTQVISVNQDTITFNYQRLSNSIYGTVSFINGISQDFNACSADDKYVNTSEYNYGFRGYYAPELPVLGKCYGETVPGLVTLVQKTESNTVVLSSIRSSSGRVIFIYSGREDVPAEKKLDTIKVIRNYDNAVIKAFKLEYIYSYAQPGAWDTYIFTNENFTSNNPELRKRLFLVECIELSSDLRQQQKFSFTYNDINGLPPRLSFAQDHFGYFNGKINKNFFPDDTWFEQFYGFNSGGGNRDYSFHYAKKGILNKIVYPTGGYSIFHHGPNKLETEYCFKRFKDSAYVLVDTSSWANVANEYISDTFHYNGLGIISLKGFCSWASIPIDISRTDYEQAYFVAYGIYNVVTQAQNNAGLAYLGDIIDTRDLSLPAGRYVIKVKANRPSLKARIVVEHNWKIGDNSDTAGIAGVRVQSTMDSDGTGKAQNRRFFHYGEWGDTIYNSGTGIRLDPLKRNQLSFSRLIVPRVDNQGNTFHEYAGYNTIHTNSILSNYSNELNCLTYRKVIEVNISNDSGNKGGIEHEFLSEKQWPALPLSFSWGGNVWDILPYVPPGAATSNNDFTSGLVKNEKVFVYDTLHRNRRIVQETINYYSVDTPNILIDTIIVAKQVINRDGSRNPDWYYFHDYDLYKYRRYFGFVKLDSSTIIKENAGSALKTKFRYTYSNFHYNRITEEHTSSKHNVVFKKYYYPHDLLRTPVLDSLLSHNIIDPVIKEKVESGSNTFETLNNYNSYAIGGVNAVLLESVSTSLNGLPPETEIHFEQYDQKGRVVQYKSREGVTNSIIWGYRGDYPVAKVLGATYNNCVAVLDTSIIQCPASDEQLRQELNKLRNLPNTFVTTLTHSPLIGVTSETDANGRTTYYEYDNFNRLDLIRDNQKNVLKRFCYNYKGDTTDCSENHLFQSPPCDSLTCSGYDKICFDGQCLTSTQTVLISSYPHPSLVGQVVCTYAYIFPHPQVPDLNIFGTEFEILTVRHCFNLY